MDENFQIDDDFCEFYGILMGDGCISKYRNQNRTRYEIRIDGNSITDYDYYDPFLLNLIHKITGRSPKIRFRKDCNGIYISFQSKQLALFLNTELGFPFGKKNKTLKISKRITGNWNLLKNVLRGFFDTDGCLYFTKNDWKKHRRYPIIELSTHSDLLLKQLKGILDSVGFNTIIVHYKDSVKLHGKKNLLRWFQLIGSNHPDKSSKLAFWTKFGFCPRIDELNYAERIKMLGP